MTENAIIFAVASRVKPKPTENIYNIQPIDEPKGIFEVYREDKLRWYKGTTYFKQEEALADIANQYEESELVFYGFTGFDSTFRTGEPDMAKSSFDPTFPSAWKRWQEKAISCEEVSTCPDFGKDECFFCKNNGGN